MAKIPTHVAEQIVLRFAEFSTPQEIVDYVKLEYGLDVTREQVWHYNPQRPDAGAANKRGGGKLAQKWHDLFWDHRERFKRETQDIGIANKAYRLKRLHDMAVKAEKMRNYALAASLHEQAAKEMGGYFTNRREIGIDARGALAALLGVPMDRLPDRPETFHVGEAKRLRLLPGGQDVTNVKGSAA